MNKKRFTERSGVQREPSFSWKDTAYTPEFDIRGLTLNRIFFILSRMNATSSLSYHQAFGRKLRPRLNDMKAEGGCLLRYEPLGQIQQECTIDNPQSSCWNNQDHLSERYHEARGGCAIKNWVGSLRWLNAEFYNDADEETVLLGISCTWAITNLLNKVSIEADKDAEHTLKRGGCLEIIPQTSPGSIFWASTDQSDQCCHHHHPLSSSDRRSVSPLINALFFTWTKDERSRSHYWKTVNTTNGNSTVAVSAQFAREWGSLLTRHGVATVSNTHNHKCVNAGRHTRPRTYKHINTHWEARCGHTEKEAGV